jgi:multidrug efflux pump subunit AcrA (membrane-fusion protein)
MTMRWFSITLATLALAACTRTEQQPAAHDTAAAPSVTLVTAQERRFTQTVAATGRFGAAAATAARLGFAEGGVIAAVHVQLGDRVAAGDAVAELDPAGFALGAQQANADVGAARAAERQARVDRTSTKIRVDQEALRRAQALYAAGVAPHKDIDAAQAELADARAEATANGAAVSEAAAQVTSARARSDIAARSVAQTTLRSPIAGTVVSVLHRAGEAVEPSDAVIVIAPAAGGDLSLLLPAADLSSVHAGDIVHYTVVGTAQRGTGTVTGVAPVVDAEAQAANVAVRAAGVSPPAGSLVEATVDTGSVKGIVLPEAAVVQDPQTGKTLVFVATHKNGAARFEQRDVAVRERRDGTVLLASGVRPGERIAAQGAFALLAPAEGGGD